VADELNHQILFAMKKTKPPTASGPLTSAAHEPIQKRSASPPLAPTLSETDRQLLADCEQRVDEDNTSSINTAKALRVLCNHADGKLWKATHNSFAAYCKARWKFVKAHAYRLANCGEVIEQLEKRSADKKSHLRDWMPVRASHLHPVLLLKRDKRADCWLNVVEQHNPAELTEKIVKAETVAFADSIGTPITAPKAEPPTPKAQATTFLEKIRAVVEEMPTASQINALLAQVEPLLT
jgi:hypothetical protein